jgi:hypothetical protein
MLTVFFAVFLPIVAAVALLPGDYVSETKVLVQRLRFDHMISANSASEESASRESLARIQEQDVDSEIDLRCRAACGIAWEAGEGCCDCRCHRMTSVWQKPRE